MAVYMHSVYGYVHVWAFLLAIYQQHNYTLFRGTWIMTSSFASEMSFCRLENIYQIVNVYQVELNNCDNVKERLYTLTSPAFISKVVIYCTVEWTRLRLLSVGSEVQSLCTKCESYLYLIICVHLAVEMLLINQFRLSMLVPQPVHSFVLNFMSSTCGNSHA